MTVPDARTFEEFRVMLADQLDADLSRIKPQAYFVTDLGVDSMRMLELLLRLQEEGFLLAPDVAWRIQTVQDAWDLWQRQALGTAPWTRQAGGSNGAP